MLHIAISTFCAAAILAGSHFGQPAFSAQSADRPATQEGTAKPANQAPALNLNTATQAQLEKLPGIGPATAARIIEYRQKSGGFKKIEDLMSVQGIGERTFLKLKPLISVTPPKATER